MSNVREQFGKPREGGGFTTFSLKEDASTIIRLLPPMKSLKEAGKWGEYHKQHFGYEVRNQRDPSKTMPRPFMCLEEQDENRLTTVSCPECRRMEEQAQALKDDLATMTEKHKASGIPAAVAEKKAAEACAERAKWVDGHRLDKKWYIPVMMEDGSFAIFRTPHAAFKAINKARKEMRDDNGGSDVFDIDAGAWLKITRTGTGLNTDYTATIVKEATVLANGKRATVVKPAPLSDEQLGQALALPDVKTSTQLIRRLTSDQVRVLAYGSGSPEEVEAVMNMAGRPDAPGPSPRPSPAQARPAPVAVVSQVQASVVEEEEDADEKAIREAQARMAAKKAAAASASASAKAAPSVKTKAILPLDDDIDEDEFAARFPRPSAS